MTETVELKAIPRDIIGKASRRLLAQGLLPAVLYGAGREPQPVAVDRHAAEMLLAGEGAGGLIIRLALEGTKGIDTIVKSVQSNPLKGYVQHIDFLAVTADHAISTQVPVHFVGDSAGVRTGGVLMHNLQALHISTLPGDLPEAIEVDVTDLAVGDSLSVGQLQLPQGVTALDDPDMIVCSVTPPTVAPTPEESAAAPTPEVVGEEEEES